MRRVKPPIVCLFLLAVPVVALAKEPHWAFQPPQRPALPRVADPSWVQTPIDAFVLARLDRAGVRQSAPADRAALLRRITFDLTGLPPTPQELDAFLTDTRPDAY